MNVPEFYTLKQCDTVTLEENSMPYIKSLYSCLNRIKGDGYTESFEKTSEGIHSLDSNQDYSNTDFRIVSFFKFEGNAAAKDNVIMYMIETNDGVKGTLVNSKELA